MPDNTIEVRVEDVSQLFHTLDPYPFRERDLDRDAEDFIVNWARDLPRSGPLHIVVYLSQSRLSQPLAQDIPVGISQHFAHRVEQAGFELRETFRIGWRSLAVGLSVLTAAIVASQAIQAKAPPPLNRVFEESLIIFGWVANWKPIETFLYDWWPIIRRRNLYRRLADATVEVKAK
jgi:hypothetical protein